MVVDGIAKFQALKFTFQGLKFPVKSIVSLVRRRICQKFQALKFQNSGPEIWRIHPPPFHTPPSACRFSKNTVFFSHNPEFLEQRGVQRSFGEKNFGLIGSSKLARTRPGAQVVCSACQPLGNASCQFKKDLCLPSPRAKLWRTVCKRLLKKREGVPELGTKPLNALRGYRASNRGSDRGSRGTNRLKGLEKHPRL